MVKANALNQGDVIIVSFDPAKGHEEKKTRPALVVSNKYFNQRTNGNCVYVCAISSSDNGFPLNVPLPDGMEIHGYVFPYQLRSMDLNSRHFKYIEHADEALTQTVVEFIEGAMN